MGEGEQRLVFDRPVCEKIQYGFHQSLGDSLVPEIGTNGQWSKERNATPSGREIRTDKVLA